MFELKNALLVDKVKEKIAKNKFIHFIGFQFSRVGEAVIEGYLPVSEHHQQQNGFAHGGLISCLCDTVAGFAAYTNIPLNKQVVTAEIKVVYYYPAIGGTLFAKGWVDKGGKKLQFCESEIYIITPDTQKKRVVAKATATMIVIE